MTDFVFNGARLSTRVTPAFNAPHGGDWCETFGLSEEVIALSIGDVCGHGTEAFPAMIATRQSIRDAAFLGLDPSQILAVANRAIRAFDPDLHATAVFALLDTRSSTVTFANAGHPPPLLVGPSGTRFLTYAIADLPLGIEIDLLPALRSASTAARTLLVLYTDGITEHERQPIRGESQLRHASSFAYRRQAPPTASGIEDLMCLSVPNRDDASMLVAWTPYASFGRMGERTGRQRDRRLRVQFGASRAKRWEAVAYS
jgi:serine phosphatase RsbU (regulator of sigma subunit)